MKCTPDLQWVYMDVTSSCDEEGLHFEKRVINLKLGEGERTGQNSEISGSDTYILKYCQNLKNSHVLKTSRISHIKLR